MIELAGPLGITRAISTISKKSSEFQSGLIYHYIFMMILGITFFILLFVLPVYFKVSLLVLFFYFFIYLNVTNFKD
jgi:hypothetical protein